MNKPPILFVSLTMLVAIFFCSIFLFTQEESNQPKVLANDFQASYMPNSTGMQTGSLNNYGFPPSKNKENLPPKLKEGAKKLDLKDSTFLLMDKASGEILLRQNENKVNAIASISKLATALVFLDQNIDWEKTYQVKAGDLVGGGKENIATGQKIKLKDLFFLSLVDSDNSATVALARSTGLSDKDFMKKLREKFAELGMTNTNFGDFSGLSDANVSTAADVAKLAKAAFARKEIREATLTKKYEYQINGAKKGVKNTDLLLDIFPQNGIKIVGGKTGFTSIAGYCFVGQFTDSKGHEIISVVLGEPDISSRFEKTKQLVHWTYANFSW